MYRQATAMLARAGIAVADRVVKVRGTGPEAFPGIFSCRGGGRYPARKDWLALPIDRQATPVAPETESLQRNRRSTAC